MQGTNLNILYGKRTPFGRAKGHLKECEPLHLARLAAEEVLCKAEVAPEEVCGLCLCTEVPSSFPPYPARILARRLDLPYESVCFAAVEGTPGPLLVLSKLGTLKSPFLLVGADSASYSVGRQEGGTSILDRITANPDNLLNLPFDADNMAKEWNLGRKELDSIALESHHKAARAWEQGLLTEELFPVLPPPDYERFIRRDEGFRPKADVKQFEAASPLKRQENGLTTFTNVALPADGASALLLGSEGPGAVIKALNVSGTRPRGSNTAFAVQSLLEKCSLDIEEIQLFEFHERSAAHLLCAVKALDSGIRGKVNQTGGAIAFGHAGGATLIRHIIGTAQRLGQGERGVVAASGGGLCGAALLEGSEK